MTQTRLSLSNYSGSTAEAVPTVQYEPCAPLESHHVSSEPASRTKSIIFTGSGRLKHWLELWSSTVNSTRLDELWQNHNWRGFRICLKYLDFSFKMGKKFGKAPKCASC